jgi:hemolysin activation/secretion protein
VPGRQFDLGLVYGPRAYPLHAFTGNRGFLVAAEYRWTFVENLGGLLGMALGTFVDYGGAWYAGDSPRTGTDFGAGLRFGPSRSANPVLFRLDVAYRVEAAPFTAGWSIVFGEGFTF